MKTFRGKYISTERRMSMNEVKQEAFSGTLTDACKRYGLGSTNLRYVAKKAKALVRVGYRYIVVYSILDDYLKAEAKNGLSPIW